MMMMMMTMIMMIIHTFIRSMNGKHKNKKTTTIKY